MGVVFEHPMRMWGVPHAAHLLARRSTSTHHACLTTLAENETAVVFVCVSDLIRGLSDMEAVGEINDRRCLVIGRSTQWHWQS